MNLSRCRLHRLRKQRPAKYKNKVCQEDWDVEPELEKIEERPLTTQP
jgi:hypothetical protein